MSRASRESAKSACSASTSDLDAHARVYGDRDILPRDLIAQRLSVPNAERIFFIRHALRAGFTSEEIFQLTKIDRWFLAQIREIVEFEEELVRSAE